MTFEEWADSHKDDLSAVQQSVEETRELLLVASREIEDALTVASPEGKLGHAHNACLALAAAVLSSRGFRVRRGSTAHHWRLIESLEYTMNLPPGKVKELQDYRKKRSLSIYERTGIVTETEAESALSSARRLQAEVAEKLRIDT
jgi:hypothetical protein